MIRGFIKILTVMLMLTSSCGSNQKSADKEKMQVAVSYGAQRWLLEQIAGDKVSVVELLPPGSDAETYDADIASMISLNHSEIYFTSATPGFEHKIMENAKANIKGLEIADISIGITPLSGHTSRDSSDPHLMNSVVNAKIMSRNMLAALIERDSINAGYYRQRYARLSVRLDSLNDALRRQIKSDFVVMHPSLSYLARDYGVRQIYLEQGGKEPTPRQLAELIEDAKRSHPSLFLIEEGHAEDRSRAIAEYIGVSTATFRQNDYSWFEQMKSIGNAFEGLN